MKRGQAWVENGWRCAVPLLCCVMMGCSTSTRGQLTLFPAGNKLIDSAKALRYSATGPLPLPRELNKGVTPAYVVEPGDTLLFQTDDFEQRLPGDAVVMVDGTISVGKYGRLMVAGKTLAEIEGMLLAAIKAHPPEAEPEAEPDLATPNPLPLHSGKKAAKDVTAVHVRLSGPSSAVYYVLGEVMQPNAQPLKGRETVLDGLMAAGGLTSRASRKNIILSRPTGPNGCRVVIPICYDEIVQLGDTTTNYQLGPGDRIYVASRTFGESCREFCKRSSDCLCNHFHTACLTPGDSCAVPSGLPGPVCVQNNKADKIPVAQPAPFPVEAAAQELPRVR